MNNIVDDMFAMGQEPEWKTELFSQLNENDIQFIRSVDIDNIDANNLEKYIKLLAGCCVHHHLVDDEHAIQYVVSIFYELSDYTHQILDSIYEYEEVDAIRKYAKLIHNIDNLIAKRKTLVNVQEFKIKQRYKEPPPREPGG
tara:strand:+ start:300 stop:725 length:426 start_codon:yes stop_codon:yes gene_type:complete